MNTEAIEVGPFGVNCYIAWGGTCKALVIDPGGDAELIMERINAQGLTICEYLLTHGHMDHIGALAEIYNLAPAPIAMHPDDLAWAFTGVNILPPFYTEAPRRPAKIEHTLADGQESADCGLRYRVIHTPGHSRGGVCFHFPDEHVLFSGDTLFAGSVGRTDLPGGDSRVLARSLAVLAELPDNTAVHPGHGPATTMAREKKTNFFMRKTRDNMPPST